MTNALVLENFEKAQYYSLDVIYAFMNDYFVHGFHVIEPVKSQYIHPKDKGQKVLKCQVMISMFDKSNAM